jgi:hypothetical protein
MTNSTYHKLTGIIASLFILLFIYTAISKLAGETTFRLALHKSPVIGPYARLVAWALPITEIMIAALLFFPSTRLYGLYASLIIMMIFTAYIGAMIFFDPNLPCSCGGVLRQMSWRQHLVFNSVFTLLAAAGIWTNKKSSHQQEFLLQ